MRHLVVLTALVLVTGTAVAQRTAGDKPPHDAAPVAAGAQTPIKATTIRFDENDLIVGATDRPDVSVIEVVRGARFNTLIRTRDDFRARVLSSVGSL